MVEIIPITLAAIVVAVFCGYVVCVEIASRRRFPDDEHENGPFHGL